MVKKINNLPGTIAAISDSNIGYTRGMVYASHDGSPEKWTEHVLYNRPRTVYSYRLIVGFNTCKTVSWGKPGNMLLLSDSPSLRQEFAHG